MPRAERAEPTSGHTEILRCDPEGEDQPSVRHVKRARGEPEQDLSGEIPIPSADETVTPPEILVVPSGSIPSSSTSILISSSSVKRTHGQHRE